MWGRDELHAGEMWNSNSMTAWIVATAGLPAARLRPPPGGRAPGWDAGIEVARRGTAARHEHRRVLALVGRSTRGGGERDEVQHPGFPQLDEDARVQVGFLALDSLLGEEEVVRWVGELSFSADPPSATDGPAELRATVERLRITAGPEGTWSLFRGQMDGAPVTGLVTRPLRPDAIRPFPLTGPAWRVADRARADGGGSRRC